MHLLSYDVHKLNAARRYGFAPAALFLPPVEFCRHSSPGCRRACLGSTSGRLAMRSAQRAMELRGQLFRTSPDAFLSLLAWELADLERLARGWKLRPCARLNGCSDVPWPVEVFKQFPGITFYDYTKDSRRFGRFLRGDMPANYHLTYSRSEVNERQCLRFLAAGGTVAVVFGGQRPERWKGYRVIDGDETDMRWLDPKGVVVGLKAKGAARHDGSGFVVR